MTRSAQVVKVSRALIDISSPVSQTLDTVAIASWDIDASRRCPLGQLKPTGKNVTQNDLTGNLLQVVGYRHVEGVNHGPCQGLLGSYADTGNSYTHNKREYFQG